MGPVQAVGLLAIFFIGSLSEGCQITIEESVPKMFTCVSEEPGDNFTGYGPRLEIDGSFPHFASCDSDGKCISEDNTKYIAYYSYSNSTKNVTISVSEITRNMTAAQCFLDGAPILASYCRMTVYAKGSTPVCEEPVFTDGGTKAVIVCVSETIYPAGTCTFSSYVLGYTNREVSGSNTPVGSNGDQRLECRLEVTVTGSEANNYKFLSSVKPFVQGLTFPSDAEVRATNYVYLTLQPTALFNTNDNGFELDYPDDGKLSLDIPITGNPEPNRVSLSVRYGKETTSTALPSEAYELTYAPSVGGAEDGILTLKVTGGLDSSQTSFFTLKADNGVLAESELEYNFSVVVQADDGDSNQFLLIGGAAGGGALLIIIIVVMVIVCRRMSDKKRRRNVEANAGYLYPNEVFTVGGYTYPPSSAYSAPPAYSMSEEEDKYHRHSYAVCRDDNSLKSDGSAAYVDPDELNQNTQLELPADQNSSFEPASNQTSSIKPPADQNSPFDPPMNLNLAFEPPVDYPD